VTPKNVVLFGFSDNMKWLLRLLQENSITPILTDWRDKYSNYDCGGHQMVSVAELNDSEDTLLVVCVEEINDLKDGINFLFNLGKHKIKIIYDRADDNIPFRQEEPYKGISDRAQKRAISMISDAQLFDLIQYIDQTKDVLGDVVEYGSLYGGSGAVIAEAVKHFGEKPVWLFDTFSGIPDSRYGLDYHWNGSFSDNSFAAVQDAFSDMSNVKVIKGNICETYNKVSNPISFGYLASDTIESGELLMNFMWPKLSPGGIICVCDYGSFPNALPLTVYVDEFIKQIADEAFVFRADRCGIFIMKNRV
jgi:O-methyltransferase